MLGEVDEQIERFWGERDGLPLAQRAARADRAETVRIGRWASWEACLETLRHARPATKREPEATNLLRHI